MFLQLEDVWVRYAGTGLQAAAVQQLSLGLERGAVGVLMGPSGCGKSSLLRAVAGLERLHQGRLRIDGRWVADAGAGLHAAAETRQVGMVFQDHALFPHLDVAANVAFGIKALAWPQRAARVREVLELVGLADAGASAPHRLSGGQQQRVALARALAPQPRLLLLDEPFSSLDVELRQRLAQELRDILKRAGTTALLVTHDPLEAFAVGDRVGVMQHGRLRQWDSGDALYHQPADRFVAGFVGQGAFVQAQRIRHDGRVLLRTGLGDFADGRDLAQAGERCELLLRAEAVRLDADAAVRARIERREFRGAGVLCTLRLDNGESVLALLPSHDGHRVGERVGIRAEPQRLVTFAR